MDLRAALPRILERCGDKRGEQPMLGSVGAGAAAALGKKEGEGEGEGSEAAREAAEKGLRDLALGGGVEGEKGHGRDAKEVAERLGREIEREART